MQNEPDIITPVADRIQTPRQENSGPKANRLTSGLCTVVALSIGAVAVWYFVGFVENDGGVLHLLTAFFFTLCLAALGWLPALLIARLAHKPALIFKRSLVYTGACVAPWLILSSLMIRLGNRWTYIGAICLLVTISALFWLFRQSRNLNRE